MKPPFLLALPLFVLLSVPGCGGQPGDMPDIGSVQGTLTLDGQPVAGASVSFYPVSGGRSASGITDEQGMYTLQYKPDVLGAKVGENTVTMSTFEAAGLVDSEDPSTGEITSKQSPGRPEEIPEKYGAGNKLTVTVEAGDNVIDLTLTR